MDPQQRLLLEVAWEALEHAGHRAERAGRQRAPASSSASAAATTASCRCARERRSSIDAYVASGIAHSIAAGRLSYVARACRGRAWRRHRLLVVAGRGAPRRAEPAHAASATGAGRRRQPDPVARRSPSRCRAAHMLAPDGRCKTFDARGRRLRARRGLRRGGAEAAVATRERDGDRILAVIRGIGRQPGRPQQRPDRAERPGAGGGDPRRRWQTPASQPADVGYVEAHGTGTSLGDPIEVQALGARVRRGRDRRSPLLIGSVKTNIGHLEAAAGIAGLIKVVLALQHGEIPPHLHFDEPNPHIAWDELPIDVPTQPTPWPHERRRRIGRRELVRLQRHQRARAARRGAGSASAAGSGRGSSHVLRVVGTGDEGARTRWPRQLWRRARRQHPWA